MATATERARQKASFQGIVGGVALGGYGPKGKPKTLTDFLIPSTLGLGIGLRTSSHILAGFEAKNIGKFNINQIEKEIRDLGISTELGLKQFSRQAAKLEGQQQVAIATTGFAASGSLVDLMTDTQTQIELQRIEKRRTAAAQEAALRTRQDLIRRETRQRQLGSFITAGAEAAGGITQLLGVL